MCSLRACPTLRRVVRHCFLLQSKSLSRLAILQRAVHRSALSWYVSLDSSSLYVAPTIILSLGTRRLRLFASSSSARYRSCCTLPTQRPCDTPFTQTRQNRCPVTSRHMSMHFLPRAFVDVARLSPRYVRYARTYRSGTRPYLGYGTCVRCTSPRSLRRTATTGRSPGHQHDFRSF